MSVDQETLYYRLARGEQEQGPIGLNELEDLVKQDSLTRHTEVRRDGSSVWIRLGRFLNVPDSDLPDQREPSLPEMANLLETFVIESDKSTRTKRTPTSERWFCRVYGKELGPVEVPLLRQMAEQRQLFATDRVRREGEAKWVLADVIPGLFEGIPAPSPPQAAPKQTLTIAPQRLVVPKNPAVAPQSPSRPSAPRTPAAAASSSPAAAERLEVAAATRPAAPVSASPAASAPGHVAARSAVPASPPLANAPSPQPASVPIEPVRPAMTAATPPAWKPPAAAQPKFIPPPRRSSSRDWSFSLPNFGDMFGEIDTKGIVAGIGAVIGVGLICWQLGLFSAGYKAASGIISGSNKGTTNWHDEEYLKNR